MLSLPSGIYAYWMFSKKKLMYDKKKNDQLMCEKNKIMISMENDVHYL